MHSYLLDMLLMCQKGQARAPGPLDVSHVMWSELQSTVFHRKVPIRWPLFVLLDTVEVVGGLSRNRFSCSGWIHHEPIMPRHKNKRANTTTTPVAATMDTNEDEVAAEDEVIPETHVPSFAKPSWAQKLQDRMKNLFCMQEKGQSMTLRKLDVHIYSGSEKDITPEVDWMEKKNLQWVECDKESNVETDEESDEESDG